MRGEGGGPGTSALRPRSPGPRPPGTGSLDGLDPLLLLLLRRGRDPVHHVVPLNHPAIRLCFAGFDELPLAVGDVKLKAVLGRHKAGGTVAIQELVLGPEECPTAGRGTGRALLVSGDHPPRGCSGSPGG